MAKKKISRQKHQKETCEGDTSDEELKTYQNVKSCPHLGKAVNFGRLKKTLKGHHNLDKCKDCKDTPVECEPNNEDAFQEAWLCLQCGYCGCGRNSPNKHAMLHYKTPRSDCHAVVISTFSMSIWCYSCDNSVLETSKTLKDCVDFIVKTKAQTPPNHLVNGTKKTLLKSTTLTSSTEKEFVTPTKAKKIEKSVTNQATKKGIIRKDSYSEKSIRGLKNLGNTCFFNAVLQNLCQTPWLFQRLVSYSKKDHIWEIPKPLSRPDETPEVEMLKLTLTQFNPLTLTFLDFLKQMKTTNKTNIVNPDQLFSQICKKAPQFQGFHQQDSHELLRHLLDGIRNEEIKRQKKAILKNFNISDQLTNLEQVDENTKNQIKAYGVFASHTIIEQIFGGQLISTVVCEECKLASQVFEPFMDLSLPISEEKPGRSGSKSTADQDEGIYVLSKRKENNPLSKHQEKKLKQQSKKNARKKSRTPSSRKSSCSEVQNESQVHEKDEIPTLEKEESLDNDDQNNMSGGELSDADVEDNNDSENISLDLPDPETKVQNIERDLEHTNMPALSERIDELCNLITDIRIRRDTDRQENILDMSNSQMEQQDSAENKKIWINELDNIFPKQMCSALKNLNLEQQSKEWMIWSLTTLKPRYQPSSLECSVNSCLNQFTASELLTGSNRFRCENCTQLRRKATGDEKEVVYSNASKQLLIYSAPAVLTLHLKRFQQTGMNLRKLSSFVEFPHLLDLAPYCSSICVRLPHMADVKDEILYSLYGVVQHRGRLTSGHYTAYVKIQEHCFNSMFLNTWPVGQWDLSSIHKKITDLAANSQSASCSTKNTDYKWFYVSDGFCKEVSETEVLQCEAYLLFYARIK